MKLAKFIELPLWQKAALPFVWLLVGWYSLAVMIIPWNFLARNMRRFDGAPDKVEPEARQQRRAMDIGRLVALAARYTPWKSECLVQVLATRRMLVLWGIPYEIHIGVRSQEQIATVDGSLGFSAHAWLDCGDRVVSGGTGHTDFTVICSYTAAPMSS